MKGLAGRVERVGRSLARRAGVGAGFAFVIAGASQAQTILTDPRPPSDPVRLAYTFTSPTEVGFMDLGSLEKRGDVVEGWSLNVFAEPFKPDYAPTASAFHWSRIRIDCAGQTARFTRGIGLVDGAPAFDVPIEMADTAVRDGWVLDEQYACQGVKPERPIVETVEAAVEQARAIMSSDAWNASGS